MVVSFLGHREVFQIEKVRERLFLVVENLIVCEGATTFLFGSRSEFDELCRKVVSELKKRHPHIQRIYVRAEYPCINEAYKKNLMERYDDTYFPEQIRNAGSAVYVERNCEMIDKSAFCVFYYDEHYKPQRRKRSKKDLSDYQPKSGTQIAYEYAVKKGKPIINLFDM